MSGINGKENDGPEWMYGLYAWDVVSAPMREDMKDVENESIQVISIQETIGVPGLSTPSPDLADLDQHCEQFDIASRPDIEVLPVSTHCWDTSWDFQADISQVCTSRDMTPDCGVMSSNASCHTNGAGRQESSTHLPNIDHIATECIDLTLPDPSTHRVVLESEDASNETSQNRKSGDIGVEWDIEIDPSLCKCPWCGQMLPDMNQMNSHMRQHARDESTPTFNADTMVISSAVGSKPTTEYKMFAETEPLNHNAGPISFASEIHAAASIRHSRCSPIQLNGVSDSQLNSIDSMAHIRQARPQEITDTQERIRLPFRSDSPVQLQPREHLNKNDDNTFENRYNSDTKLPGRVSMNTPSVCNSNTQGLYIECPVPTCRQTLCANLHMLDCHLSLTHPGFSPPYVCKDMNCGDRYSSLQLYMNHVKIHGSQTTVANAESHSSRDFISYYQRDTCSNTTEQPTSPLQNASNIWKSKTHIPRQCMEYNIMFGNPNTLITRDVPITQSQNRTNQIAQNNTQRHFTGSGVHPQSASVNMVAQPTARFPLDLQIVFDQNLMKNKDQANEEAPFASSVQRTRVTAGASTTANGKRTWHVQTNKSMERNKMFHCSRFGCIKKYKYQSGLDRHLETYGGHLADKIRHIQSRAQEIKARTFEQTRGVSEDLPSGTDS